MASVRRRRHVRKGVSSMQTVVMVAAIVIVVVATVSFLGRSTRTDLNKTATNVADPATLVHRWGR
jgi:hypothetical protein